jgi:hypothetical protein
VNDRVDPHPSEEDETPELAEVRRLLADARHDEPMPADVAERMGRVITGLGDESAVARSEPTAAVIPISGARRRRAAGLLVAAAAIVVGGVVFQNVHLSSSGESSPSSAAAEDSGGEQSFDSGNTGHSGPQVQQTPDPTKAVSPVKVHPRRFASDAIMARRELKGVSYSANLDTAARAAGCIDVPRRAHVVPATYKHAPAALVFQRPRGGTQVVDLYVCPSPEPIRSTTLSVP